MFNINKRVIMSFAAVAALSACASSPDKMQSSYVSPMKYSDFTCKQIGMESENTSRRIQVLYNTLKKEADTDKWQMGVGLLVFWPALVFVEGGDGAEAAEYSRLKGEFEALQSAAVNKSC